MVEVGESAAVADRAALMAKLEQSFRDRCEPHQAQALAQFARVFFAHFPLLDWQGRTYSDVLGCCYTLWHQLQTPRQDFPSVRVFNPSLEEHGWLCGRTVITVLQQDIPFLVDSIRLELNRRDIPIHILKSNVLRVGRSHEGVPQSVLSGGEKPQPPEGLTFNKEALVYIEISLHSSEAELVGLRKAVEAVLQDVHRVVDDFGLMLERVERLQENLDVASRSSGQQTAEVREFLQWLTASHFTFLGYRQYDFIDQDGQKVLREDASARLGIFRKLSGEVAAIPESEFSEGMRNFHQSEDLVAFSKSSTRTRIHRSVYPDYVVVKRFDENGVVVGEARFLGQFTYSVYTLTPTQIPLVREKVAQIMDRSNLDPDSHDGKNLRRVIENFPRDELFQTPVDELYENVIGVANINERRVVRLIMRKDPFGNFVTCLVYVPRDIYNTDIRIKIEKLIGDAINSHELDSTTYFSESILARAQIVFRVDSTREVQFDRSKLEEAIVALTRSWRDQLEHAFVDALGEGKGLKQYRLYKDAFSSAYQESFDARTAVHDVALLERLREDCNIAMNFYQPLTAEKDHMRFKVLHPHSVVELSQVVPVLENLGLRVLGEHPFQIRPRNGGTIWLHDFELKFGLPVSVDAHAVRNQFEDAFANVWRGATENDAFNKLVLGARLNWREVNLLRAYAAYMKQTEFNFSADYIADTLANHLDITRNLVALFKALFEPRLQAKAVAEDPGNRRVERLQRKILEALEQVPNLNEDRILRHYLELIQATLRTNYYQKEADGSAKTYLSIKFNPKRVPGIPQPRPEYEIFVYSPQVEGVHLRGGKVARGGLRWSDRLQDYRTEILGLMKAQQVKNAVIVPTGAKGGFVPKQMPAGASREERQAEGIACYKTFIRGLLDLTDNFVGGSLVPPEEVVRRDDDDPYLVVAADKGTATFSDIANEISLRYNHWLGDAFASGGSQGYDHKRMGITARGAWVSVQRHFREQGLDIQQTDFSVIGIGDMSGDVFGNGMLLSRHIRLLAAFNHLHIFVDPDPNTEASYVERERLFHAPNSAWSDYNSDLISRGGGVFSRDAKSITITPEMRRVFDIQADKLTPNELIHALLKAPVDLLWNGGIGTYIKSSSETHAQVGDKANDGLRVNGEDLRCKVIGEGGNLGVTQLGRVEFALNGGACNTDFIDNAGGVDCSDHEVNIKILLDEMIASGDLTLKQRNQMLSQMTEEVAELVLQNNYRQTQAISIAEFQAGRRYNEYRRFITHLESSGRLDRALEFLPDDESLVERQAQGKHLTRPEMAVLISYSKMLLKEELSATRIAEDPYVARYVESAFPRQIKQAFPEQLYRHRLLKQIVATQVANDLINNLGITGSHRLQETTGASADEVAKAYIVARDIFEFEEFNDYVRALDNEVPAEFQAELLINMIRRVRRGTRWFLRNRRSGMDASMEVENFRRGIEQIQKNAGTVLSGIAEQAWQERCDLLRTQEVPEKWIGHLAMPDNLFSGLGIVEAAGESEVAPEVVAWVFFRLMELLNLNWFANQISEVRIDTYWQALARESLIDDMETQIRKLSVAILRLRQDRSESETLSLWQARFESLVTRWKTMVNEVQGAPGSDFAMFSVAMRELIDLVQATEHCTHLD